MSCCSGRRMGRYGTVINADMLNAVLPATRDGLINNGSIGVDYVDGQINIHGQLVGGQPPAKTGIVKALDDALAFAKDNPLLTLGGVVGLYLVARR